MGTEVESRVIARKIEQVQSRLDDIYETDYFDINEMMNLEEELDRLHKQCQHVNSDGDSVKTNGICAFCGAYV